jgi:hypothetical protein
MPRLSAWMIRTALLYLGAGFTLGALLLAHKGWPIHPALWQLLPAQIEFLLIGWLAQLVVGVAFWILPRFRNEPKRGNERLVWLCFILLNAGIWITILAPAFTLLPWLALLGRLALAAAALLFGLHAWKRVYYRSPS